MKFHKVENIGKLLVEKSGGVPSWTANDESRLIYDLTTERLYYADATSYEILVISGEIANFIEAVDVTFDNLNANGSIGVGSSQVSQGDHTHPNLIDVPSGETILFQKDTVVTGYTLEIDLDDQLVYISSGGAGGLKPTSTWTQPNHVHTTRDHTLIIAEIPDHSHIGFKQVASGTGNTTGSNAIGTSTTGDSDGGGPTSSVGGDDPHNHGSTYDGATVNSWRPKGQNFTRQTKI